jgi:amino acid adenylation domain-containing protein
MTEPIDQQSANTLQAMLVRGLTSHGQNPAIVTRDATLSYAEVSDQAWRLARCAHRTYEATGGPRLLGVFGIHGADAYAAVYAGLIAGGGYVPLNPSFPAERLAHMVRDSGVPIVYVCRRAAAEFEKFRPHVPADVQVITADDVPGESHGDGCHWHLASAAGGVGCQGAIYAADWQSAPRHWQDAGGTREFPTADETTCAYILYTSGSTGKPKGVMVSHGNVTHYVREMVALYGFTRDDRFSQTFDLTFDLSVIGTFCAPAVGGAIHPMEKLDRLSPVRYVGGQSITVWSSVPSLAVNMQKLGLLRPEAMPSLRWSIFCGEPLTVACARQWRRAAPSSRVENVYGPTEATVSCTRYAWDDEAERRPHRNGIVPIGLPLPGTRLAILGGDGRHTPLGPGELCIAGQQLCLGYTDPAQTAAAFFERDGRWYRTGDLVAFNPEAGAYEFLGRLDWQIKVQGNRVELGEVESVLRAAFGCDAAVVVPHPVEAGSARGLVAFLERRADGPDEAAIRRVCRERLPEYMCPTRYVFVKALPLNSNGKYDRAALRKECENHVGGDQDMDRGVSDPAVDEGTPHDRHPE